MLQGEPISARIRGTEIPSPWYPPGDKIERRTAHSPQGGSHTLSAQFPCMCPVHPHMSAGRDFFESLIVPHGTKSPCVSFTGSARAFAVAEREQCVRSRCSPSICR